MKKIKNISRGRYVLLPLLGSAITFKIGPSSQGKFFLMAYCSNKANRLPHLDRWISCNLKVYKAN